MKHPKSTYPMSTSKVIGLIKKITEGTTLWSTVSPYLQVTTEGEDEGINIQGGQFSVGTMADGRESVFGQGDSIVPPIAYHYSTSNEAAGVITSASDITTVISSGELSSVSLFANNLAEESLLIGSTDGQFFGLKNKYSSIGTLESGKVVLEYLNNSGVWTDISFMITESVYPYRKASWKMASYASEHVRFGHSILDPLNGSWTPRILNINGVNDTKHWARLRLVSPATTLPMIEQIKIHTSRTEINEDGIVEFFGLARGIQTLQVAGFANNLSDPANENVLYFTGGLGAGAKLVDNEFAINTSDSRILIAKVDNTIDTSTPLVLSFPFYVKGANTGDIKFNIEYIQIEEDFQYNSSVNPDGSFSVIHTVSSPSENIRQFIQVEIPINKTNPIIGGVAVVITRDATDVLDTLGASIVNTGQNVDGRRWRL